MKVATNWWRLVLVSVVVLFAAWWGYQLLAVRGTFAPSRSASKAGGDAVLIGPAGHRIAGRVFVTGTPAEGSPMIVVLHGDAPYINPSYQYYFASQVADAVPGTRVVALLRPGYADPYGAKSDGNRGFAVGENYTSGVVNDVAAAIQSLKRQWGISKVLLVGHSGGATVAANIAALHPDLVQHVFLVSCPCNVPAFRRHMARAQWSPMWLLPVRSLSPIETLDRMQPGTEVTAISGTSDPIALPQYAQSYIARANARGIEASMIWVPGKGHEILNDAIVTAAVANGARTIADGQTMPRDPR